MTGLGGGGSTTPKVTEPVRMPSPGDTALREARQLQLEQLRATTGRQSTILTSNLSGNANGSRGTLGA